jgi:hypothetical protein
MIAAVLARTPPALLFRASQPRLALPIGYTLRMGLSPSGSNWLMLAGGLNPSGQGGCTVGLGGRVHHNTACMWSAGDTN